MSKARSRTAVQFRNLGVRSRTGIHRKSGMGASGLVFGLPNHLKRPTAITWPILLLKAAVSKPREPGDRSWKHREPIAGSLTGNAGHRDQRPKERDRLLEDWKHQARGELLALRAREGAWGYKRGTTPSVEPSVLASLGLLASGDPGSAHMDHAVARNVAEWMATIQNADGSLGVSQGIETPAWTTPYGLLLWSGMRGFESSRSHGRNWLLQLQGRTLPRGEPGAKLFGHDSMAVGWPWVEGTHSWLEPTALSIVALCRLGLADHPRVAAGIHLILDRTLKGGGWNYGNSAVFGRDLRPQPGPSGLALLALSAHQDDSPEISRGIDYLRRALGEVRTGVSLGWGVLGLRAWGASPGDAETWLGESYRRSRARPDAAVSVALLLLAASDPALDLFVKPAENTAAKVAPSWSSPVNPTRISS